MNWRFVYVAVCAAVACQATLAQTFLRRNQILSGFYTERVGDDDVNCGSLHILPNTGSASSNLEWIYRDTADQLHTCNVPVPFNCVGGIVRVTDTGWLLAGGAYSGGTCAGVLCKLRLLRSGTALSYVYDEVMTLPNIDPAYACYNGRDGHVYLWDYLGERILAASWQGYAGQLPDSTAFSVVTTKAATPQLRSCLLASLEPSNCDFDLDEPPENPTSSYPRPWTVGCQLFDCESLALVQFAPDGIGGWATQTTSTDYFLDPVHRLTVSPHVFVGSSTNLTLAYLGGGSRSFELIDAWSGSVVLSGTATSGGAIFAAPAAFLSDPGRPYLLRDPAAEDWAVGTTVTSAVRYGLPLASSDVTLSRGLMPVHGPDTRQAALSLPWGAGALIDSKSASTGWYLGVLYLALRRDDGSDPVTINGNVAELTPDASVGFSGTVNALGADVSNLINFFDGDDAWDGAVLLMQYAILTENGVAATDVFGRTIRAMANSEEQLLQRSQRTGVSYAERYPVLRGRLHDVVGVSPSSARISAALRMAR